MVELNFDMNTNSWAKSGMDITILVVQKNSENVIKNV